MIARVSVPGDEMKGRVCSRPEIVRLKASSKFFKSGGKPFPKLNRVNKRWRSPTYPFQSCSFLRRSSGLAGDEENLSQVAFSQGDLSAAKPMLAEALRLFREGGNKSGAAYVLVGLGQVAQTEGGLAAARKYYQDAVATRNELGEKGNNRRNPNRTGTTFN